MHGQCPIELGIDEPCFDFGDAPDMYRTRAASLGPVHRLHDGIHLGKDLDGEFDGQPSRSADEDDRDSLIDDEDGVRLLGSLVPGMTTTVEVDASTDGYLSAWIDWRRDGSFDAIDQIFATEPVKAGTNTLSINVPPQAGPTETYARYRFTTENIRLGPTGAPKDLLTPEEIEAGETIDLLQRHPDGEVEDYRVEIVEANQELQFDFGDAPQSYGTTRADHGPLHRIEPGVYLGREVDGESDGKVSPLAKGDDTTPSVLNDDEDGVRIGKLVQGNTANVQIGASTGGFVNAWLDFNGDGTFSNAEKVLDGQPVVGGPNTFSISVPIDATPTNLSPTFARFRFSESHQFLPHSSAPGCPCRSAPEWRG